MMGAFVVMLKRGETPSYNSSYQENCVYENNEGKSKPVND
jgi:hypothetical protein